MTKLSLLLLSMSMVSTAASFAAVNTGTGGQTNQVEQHVDSLMVSQAKETKRQAFRGTYLAENDKLPMIDETAAEEHDFSDDC